MPDLGYVSNDFLVCIQCANEDHRILSYGYVQPADAEAHQPCDICGRVLAEAAA